MDPKTLKDIDQLFEDPDKPAGRSDLDDITERLEKIASADLREAYDENGMLKSPIEWSDDFAMAVDKTAHSGGRINAVQLVPRGRALESLAKIKGAFDNKDDDLTPFEKMLSAVDRADLKLIISNLLEMAKQKGLQTEEDEDEKDQEFAPENELPTDLF